MYDDGGGGAGGRHHRQKDAYGYRDDASVEYEDDHARNNHRRRRNRTESSPYQEERRRRQHSNGTALRRKESNPAKRKESNPYQDDRRRKRNESTSSLPYYGNGPYDQISGNHRKPTLPGSTYQSSHHGGGHHSHNRPDRIRFAPPCSADEMIRSASKTGYLKKQADNEPGSWNRYFFAIKPVTYLYYYSSEKDEKPRGVIDMEYLTDIRPDSKCVQRSVGGSRATFRLSGHLPPHRRENPDKSKLRPIYLDPEGDVNEAKAWMSAIKHHRYDPKHEEKVASLTMQLVKADEKVEKAREMLEREFAILRSLLSRAQFKVDRMKVEAEGGDPGQLRDDDFETVKADPHEMVEDFKKLMDSFLSLVVLERNNSSNNNRSQQQQQQQHLHESRQRMERQEDEIAYLNQQLDEQQAKMNLLIDQEHLSHERIEEERRIRGELEDQLQRVQMELDSVHKQVYREEVSRDQLTQQLAREQQRNDKLEHQLSQERQARDDLSRQLNQAEHKAAALASTMNSHSMASSSNGAMSIGAAAVGGRFGRKFSGGSGSSSGGEYNVSPVLSKKSSAGSTTYSLRSSDETVASTCTEESTNMSWGRTRIASGGRSDSLPRNWAKKESRSHPGEFYYVNELTNETSWEFPATVIREDEEFPVHEDSDIDDMPVPPLEDDDEPSFYKAKSKFSPFGMKKPIPTPSFRSKTTKTKEPAPMAPPPPAPKPDPVRAPPAPAPAPARAPPAPAPAPAPVRAPPVPAPVPVRAPLAPTPAPAPPKPSYSSYSSQRSLNYSTSLPPPPDPTPPLDDLDDDQFDDDHFDDDDDFDEDDDDEPVSETQEPEKKKKGWKSRFRPKLKGMPKVKKMVPKGMPKLRFGKKKSAAANNPKPCSTPLDVNHHEF